MKSNNSTLTGILLLVMLWVGYNMLTAPSKEQLELQQQAEAAEARKLFLLDSLRQVEEDAAQQQIIALESDTQYTAAQRDSLQKQILQQQLGSQFDIFTQAAMGQSKQVTLENDKLLLTFDTKGGFISQVLVKGFLQYNHATEDPYDKEPLVLFNDPQNKFEYLIPLTKAGKGSVSTADLYFEPILEGQVLRMRAYGADRSQYIEQKYTLGDNYVVDYQVTMENINDHMPRDENIRFNWESYIHKVEKNPHYEATMTTVYYKSTEDGFDYCDCRSSDKEELENPVDWVSHSQQFFNTSIFSKEGTVFNNAKLFTFVADEGAPQLKRLRSEIDINFKDQKSAAYDMQLYIGPNDYNDLAAVGNDFERIIPFGWSIFGFISRSIIRPLFNFFAMFISNYGIIILLLTFLIRLVLFPVAVQNATKWGKNERDEARARCHARRAQGQSDGHAASANEDVPRL